MSSQQAIPEQVCYVNCNFCNTILVVNIPCYNSYNVVAVRCGHCANLLSVNLGAVDQKHIHNFHQNHNIEYSQGSTVMTCGSSSSRLGMMNSSEIVQQENMPIQPSPEKRQRVPSAYNRFIKEEIRRLKATNPQISHREAFSAAAKNWAHFPNIHFGLSIERNKQVSEGGCYSSN